MSTVRDRLVKLKNRPTRGLPPIRRETPRDSVLLSPEITFIRKIESLIKNIQVIRRKMMSDSGQYLSLYYDMKKAQKVFLEAVEDPEMQYLDLSDVFQKRVNEMKQLIAENKI
tara:strand:+ start:56 stop:394 length:339 start_codon:yes stop_codon:yes gene_type:complete